MQRKNIIKNFHGLRNNSALMKYSKSFIEMFNSLGKNPDMGDIEFLTGFASGLMVMRDMADKNESIAANIFFRTYDMLKNKYQAEIDDLKTKLEKYENLKFVSNNNNYHRPNVSIILSTPKCGTTRYLIKDVLTSAYCGNDVIYVGDYSKEIIHDIIDIYYNIENEETISTMLSHIKFVSPSKALSKDEFVKLINNSDVFGVYINNSSLWIEDVHSEYKLNEFLLDLINQCPKVRHFMVSYQYNYNFNEVTDWKKCYHSTSANSVILLSKENVKETENGFTGHYKFLINKDEFGNNLYLDGGDYLLKLKK